MKQTRLPIALIALLPLMLALPFGMDIYVPAVPKITAYFHTSDTIMQATLNLFMVTSGIIQLIIGPLSDTFGRLKTTLACAFLFTWGCLMCAYAPGITYLIVGRIIQAMGASGLLMLGNAIARDLYTDTDLAIAYCYLNGVISFSPLFAPFIGSFLDVYYGWESTFLMLLFIPTLTLLLYWPLLGETLQPSKRSNWNYNLLRQYLAVIKTPSFMPYAIASAIGMSYAFIFCTTSPVLLIKILHVPEINYGYYFCFMGVSFLLGSLMSANLVKYLGIYRSVTTGFYISLIGGIWMFLWHLQTGLTVNNFVWPMLVIGTGGIFTMGAATAGAMLPFSNHTGVASALSGSIRFIFAGIIGLVIANHIHTALPLAIPAIIFSVFGLILFKLNYKTLDSGA